MNNCELEGYSVLIDIKTRDTEIVKQFGASMPVFRTLDNDNVQVFDTVHCLNPYTTS